MQEKDRAEHMQYPNPINPSYAATSKQYDNCVRDMLAAVDTDGAEVCRSGHLCWVHPGD